MNTAEAMLPPVLPEKLPPIEKTLRRLFLTLFLRGRGGRGLKKQGAPKSLGEKLALTLFFYGLFGCMALFFLRQPIFALAVYLHAMTFVFLGMFVASSAGEILFNKDEGDILLHRPISPKTMLWAKIRVLVEVSLWLAGAFNLVGLFVGLASPGNGRLFIVVHLISTTLEALFCTGCVVLVYQLCLRWFGRERLENLMTIAQVAISVTAVAAGQILPQVAIRFSHVLTVNELPWWINLLPPAWFAGLDDAVSGSGMAGAWVLAAAAVTATATVMWLAFSKLARDYELGLQALGETVSSRVKKPGNRPRLLDRLVTVPPLSWWLRNPVERASFLLTAAYLTRDRDVKLRIYPGIAPVLIIPFIFLIRNQSNTPGFGVPFSGVYLGMVPLYGLQILQYSQQAQAAEIFRTAPLAGPASICNGARRAVLCFLAFPMLILMGLLVWAMRGDFSQLILLLPGIIALPVFAVIPHVGGHAVPLSTLPDASKAARRGLSVILVMFVAFALAGLTSVSWSHGWFWWLVMGESVVAVGLYVILRLTLSRSKWAADE
jgi:ABC-2 type transport system permease protein